MLCQAEENHSACSCYSLCHQSRGPGHLDYLAVFVSVDHSKYSHSENAVDPRLRPMFYIFYVCVCEGGLARAHFL